MARKKSVAGPTCPAAKKRETILRFAPQRLAIAVRCHYLAFSQGSGHDEYPQSSSDRRKKERAMAKPTTQDRGQRPGFSVDAIPVLDPTMVAANLESCV